MEVTPSGFDTLFKRRQVSNLAAALYKQCVTTLQIHLEQMKKSDWQPDQLDTIRHNLAQLILWGEGIHDIQLDALLMNSISLMRSVLEVLNSLGTALIADSLLSIQDPRSESNSIFTTMRSLLTGSQALLTEMDPDGASTISEAAPSETSELQFDPKQSFIEDLERFMRLLFQIAPSIEAISNNMPLTISSSQSTIEDWNDTNIDKFMTWSNEDEYTGPDSGALNVQKTLDEDSVAPGVEQPRDEPTEDVISSTSIVRTERQTAEEVKQADMTTGRALAIQNDSEYQGFDKKSVDVYANVGFSIKDVVEALISQRQEPNDGKDFVLDDDKHEDLVRNLLNICGCGEVLSAAPSIVARRLRLLGLNRWPSAAKVQDDNSGPNSDDPSPHEEDETKIIQRLLKFCRLRRATGIEDKYERRMRRLQDRLRSHYVDENAPDILNIVYMGKNYKFEFAPYSIGESFVTVRNVRELAAEKLNEDPTNILLEYKGRELCYDDFPVKKYGCKQESEIQVTIGQYTIPSPTTTIASDDEILSALYSKRPAARLTDAQISQLKKGQKPHLTAAAENMPPTPPESTISIHSSKQNKRRHIFVRGHTPDQYIRQAALDKAIDERVANLDPQEQDGTDSINRARREMKEIKERRTKEMRIPMILKEPETEKVGK